VAVTVENDATAAALYEARRRLRSSEPGEWDDFVLVRAGTGVGVGLVLGGEVYRGAGADGGLLGEFGHMTIVAGGKPCACGNRGCWERYASAASASTLYAGERAQVRGGRPPRFVEIVARAAAGEVRARSTLERTGEYLGVGIGNVISGLGVARVVLSGRVAYGWKFIEAPLKEAVARTMAGRLSSWSVEPGEPTGAGLGGALEVAVERHLTRIASQSRTAA
jgi:predicted NBD/HSP70 family sugar kinase